MKKLMILAALGTAALFTACGDDSSSGSSDVCEVTATENSVSLTTKGCVSPRVANWIARIAKCEFI